jgi:hypothetical protein
MTKSAIFLFCLSATLICGCAQSDAKVEEKPPEKKGIIGKTTDDIGRFDPNAVQVVSDQKIRASDPITAPLSAYGPMVEKISIISVDYSMGIFRATEDRFPKDYDEFMEKIIKANNIRLPVLPYKGRYMYDEANHTLVIVRDPAEAAKQ